MMDRFAALIRNPGLKLHICQRCKQCSGCGGVTWMCPHCNTYSSDFTNTWKGSGVQSTAAAKISSYSNQ
ncbi:hypothetical protein AB6A40_010111 [Gnathostoma spinigerum]|uniref:Uncharacterized protein n=1 Tax=Gnathostoma spinigerum TaxID=75299 RepID=A0ABD6F1V3_9BILA